jgi:hypothetical protein
MADDGTDFLLYALRASVAKPGYMATITLQMGGFLVTGTLIGSLDYFTALQDAMAYEGTAGTTDLAHSLGVALETAKERAEQSKDLPESERPSPPASPARDTTLCMRDVVVVLPSGHRLNIPLWRGSIAAVSGWWFGTMEFDS